MRSNSSSVTSATIWLWGTPAMLPMTSTRPYSPAARSTSASTSARFVTSVRNGSAVPPREPISSAVAWAPFSSMSPSTTVAPAPERTNAVARPRPLAAPVSTPTRADRSNASSMPDVAATSAIHVSFDTPSDLTVRQGAEPTPGAPKDSGSDVKLSGDERAHHRHAQPARRAAQPAHLDAAPAPPRSSAREGVVDLAAAECGATVHWASFGRGIVEPWPHIISARPHRACGRIGIAVLSRPPAQLVQMIPVGDVPGDPASRRCALRVALVVDGDNIDLIAVHLTSRLPYGPPMQIRNLRRRLPAPDERTVIVGDFNLWGPAVTALLPGWRRAVRGRTWPAHRPHSQIDHVLVRDDVDVVEAEVLDEVGSDHRPVRVTLRLP